MPSGDSRPSYALSAESQAALAALIAARDAKIRPEWRLSEAELSQAKADKTKIIAFVEGKLSPREKEITSWTASEALAKMHGPKGDRATIPEVVEAVCHRAALVHQLTNCLTEILFEEAIRDAEEKERAFVANGYKVPEPASPNGLKPLIYGLPVSIKDEHDLAGTRTTWGFVEWALDPPREADGDVCAILRASGAVFFCKTNIPTALMTWESTNNVWGRALNPHNLDIAPGGSSGGEGAVVGSGASFLGSGTDIGGSIRMPASLCGAYGLKPSCKRFAYTGSRVVTSGYPPGDAVPPVHGPLGKSVEDLELYTRVFTQPETLRYDPNVTPMPFTPVKLPAKLKFAYFWDNGYIAACPPVAAAVLETVEKLRKAGHEVVEFKIGEGEMKAIADCVFAFYGGYKKELLKIIGPKSKLQDPIIPALSNYEDLAALPDDDPSLDPPISKLWKLFGTREGIKAEWTRRFLDLGIDAIVSPTTAIPAPLHDQAGRTVQAIIYCACWNLLDWTSGIIPAKFLTKDELKPYPSPARNPAEEAVVEAWNTQLDKYENAPVGIQVTGLRLTEEKTLEVMKVVDKALKA
ncbi:amidase signature domain-containing protein [Hyaloraphidium curvatum]|nr:amidase signature domain-containing protein [Hyaloraphidium curvatum]